MVIYDQERRDGPCDGVLQQLLRLCARAQLVQDLQPGLRRGQRVHQGQQDGQGKQQSADLVTGAKKPKFRPHNLKGPIKHMSGIFMFSESM
jgi:hypothetical protein